jgi:ParB family chromosome partitioning protein
LIPTDLRESAPIAGDTLQRIPVDRVRPNPNQPRKRFDAQAMNELADSIREHGVISPIVVRRDREGFVLVAGERRLRASKMAGLVEIPAVVRGSDLAADAQLVLALVENLQRDDLDALEAAESYQRLVQEFGLKQDDVARRVGKDRATVANALRLLRLPPAGRDAVVDGRITAGHARALLPLVETPVRFESALRTTIDRQLNVRGTEGLVRAMLAPPPKAGQRPARKATDQLAQELTRELGAKVRIAPGANGKGRIVLDYTSAAELERLVDRLRAQLG